MTSLLYGERARQASVDAYGLGGVRPVDPASGAGALDRLVLRAQHLLHADFGVINILDDDRQVPIAATPGVPTDVTKRSLSVCDHVIRRHPGGETFVATDLSRDPELEDNPWVTGELGSVRFFAAAPLIGLEGLPLGTVCVWSHESMEVPPEAAALLAEVRNSVVAVLDARRSHLAPVPVPAVPLPRPPAPPTSPVPTPAATPVPPAPVSAPVPASPPAEPSADVPRKDPAASAAAIAAVIEAADIRTLFQPVVHLETGAVVGFEALSRGPAGSALESPVALLTAAEEAGRLGELDWLCRVLAMAQAAAADLPPSLSWFINVEPAGLEISCPEHLAPALARARRDLRVVLEVVERDAEGYVTRLLRATDQARADAWGVALDDVGVNSAALALLPFLQPDVVKLDMRLVRQAPDAETASTTADVRAYAERTGAMILATGIETPEHERLARVFGATYGQGYRYGEPGQLPEAIPIPREAVPLRQHPESLSGSTPYEILSSRGSTQRARAAELVHIGRHVEALAHRTNEESVVLACFQDSSLFTADDLARYRELADQHALTVVLAPGLDVQISPRNYVGPFDEGRLHQEWNVIVLGPREACAFVARACGDTGAPDERRFDFIYTFDRSSVALAARAFVQALLPVSAEEMDPPDGADERPDTPADASARPRWRPTGPRRGHR